MTLSTNSQSLPGSAIPRSIPIVSTQLQPAGPALNAELLRQKPTGPSTVRPVKTLSGRPSPRRSERCGTARGRDSGRTVAADPHNKTALPSGIPRMPKLVAASRPGFMKRLVCHRGHHCRRLVSPAQLNALAPRGKRWGERARFTLGGEREREG